MQNEPRSPWVYRLAVLTACVALLPVTFGALTTTMGAGMAFPDWPSSDGHSMIAYPWLNSVGDKFLEHGHRLAGMLIGVFSIGLAVVAWRRESRLWVRLTAAAILLCVIGQGVLGGLRVLANDPRLAMIHGLFAAMVFALMAAVALFTSRSWADADGADLRRDPNSLKPWAVLVPLMILGQYALGGLLRHLGTAVFEHMTAAVVVFLFVLLASIATARSGQRWLSRPAWTLLGLTVTQISLGLATFVTKFGFKATGYVAVHEAPVQVWSRTSHTIVGMLLFMTAVIYSLRVFRLSAVWNAQHPDPLAGLSVSPLNMTVEGGSR